MIPESDLPGLQSPSMTTALTTILGYSAMSGVIGGGVWQDRFVLRLLPLPDRYHDRVCHLLVLMVQVFQTLGTAWATRSDKRLRK